MIFKSFRRLGIVFPRFFSRSPPFFARPQLPSESLEQASTCGTKNTTVAAVKMKKKRIIKNEYKQQLALIWVPWGAPQFQNNIYFF